MAITPKIKPIHLLTDAAVNGSSASYSVWGPRLAFQFAGTWNGATISLETSLDEGTTWNTITGHAYTTDTAKVVWVTRGMLVRATITNAGASTVLNAWLLLSNENQ